MGFALRSMAKKEAYDLRTERLGKDLFEPRDFSAIRGKGIFARLDGQEVLIGNRKLWKGEAVEKKQQQFSIWYFIVAMIALIAIQNLFITAQVETISYSQFKALARKGMVTDLVIGEQTIRGNIRPEAVREVFSAEKLKQLGHDGKKPVPFHAVKVEDPGLTAELEDVGIAFKGEVSSTWLPTMLSWIVPVVLFFLLWSYLFKRMGAGSGMMQIGKSKAKVYIEKETGVTFADVEGIDEAEEELVEVVDFLKNPGKYQRLGGHIPKGVLLLGPPGTGKTLLARAVAGEAGVPFFSISGSDFVEMFVGVGAARVRDLFAQAVEHAPSIIFIDELDAVGRHRGSGLGGGHDEREQTLNQLLVEIDGMDSKEGVILIAATNRADVLDRALLRPGRFDRSVIVNVPDYSGRLAILKVHARKVKMGEDVDLKEIALRTQGMAGAELEAIINEAALYAARKRRRSVTQDDMLRS